MTAPPQTLNEASTNVSSPQTTFLVDGETVTMPVQVRSARMAGAQYFVDAHAAQALIEYSGLRVVRKAHNRAICSLSAVQYLDNDLGVYDEIALAFVVHPHDAAPGAKTSFSRPTTFIHQLPVNQAFTCAAGRTIWGFPKWVASIEVRTRGTITEAVLVDDDEFVLSLSIKHSPFRLPAAEIEMSCYSACDGILRATPWTTRNEITTARIGGARLELGSRHPMAQELRSLGLPKTAFMSMSTGAMTARFDSAQEVRGLVAIH